MVKTALSEWHTRPDEWQLDSYHETGTSTRSLIYQVAPDVGKVAATQYKIKIGCGKRAHSVMSRP